MIALWGLEESLGHQLSHQTVGNILRRHGLSPAPKRKQAISWKDSIRSQHICKDACSLTQAKGGPSLIYH
jgi:hypothetical protein